MIFFKRQNINKGNALAIAVKKEGGKFPPFSYNLKILPKRSDV